METLKKFGRFYDKLEASVLAAVMGATTILIFIQVIMRYVFNNSISWSEELARYIFVWLIWMGTSMAQKDQTHICMTIVSDRIHGKGRYILDIFLKAVLLALCVFMAVNGAEIIASMIPRAKMSPTMPWLPMWVVYLSVPVSQMIVAIRVVIQLIEDVVNMAKGKEFQLPGDGEEGAN